MAENGPGEFELPTAWFVGATWKSDVNQYNKLDGPPSRTLPLRSAKTRREPSKRYDFATFDRRFD